MSKIKVSILVGESAETFQFEASSLKEVLSLLKLQKGQEFIDELVTSKYKFLLTKEDNTEDVIYLAQEVLFSDFGGYDILYIVPEIEGSDPLTLSFIIIGTSLAAATTTQMILAYIISAVILIAASFAINMIMSLLSPTPEFNKDPGSQQKSDSFNGAPMIRNQGSSVPLVFGRPYCGCVLISSCVDTENKVAKTTLELIAPNTVDTPSASLDAPVLQSDAV